MGVIGKGTGEQSAWSIDEMQAGARFDTELLHVRGENEVIGLFWGFLQEEGVGWLGA